MLHRYSADFTLATDVLVVLVTDVLATNVLAIDLLASDLLALATDTLLTSGY